LAAFRYFDGDALAVRSQAEACGLAAIRQRQAQQLAGGAVFQDCHPFRSLLHEGSDVPAVPAQGWRAVGLVAAQMAQRHRLTAWLPLKDHHGLAPLFQHRSEKPAIAADGRVLTVLGAKGTEGTNASPAEQPHA
jgi:hypothetical protein